MNHRDFVDYIQFSPNHYATLQRMTDARGRRAYEYITEKLMKKKSKDKMPKPGRKGC